MRALALCMGPHLESSLGILSGTMHLHVVGLGYENYPNFGSFRTDWNSNELIPRLKVVSILICTNIAPRLKKSINELKIIVLYIMDKILSGALFSLLSIIVHCMRDKISTEKANCVFCYPLLLINIFCHFNVDLSNEQRENTDNSNIVSGLTISQSGFEYDKEEKKWLTMTEKHAKKGKRETVGFECTRPACHPGKAVAEEKGEDEDYEAQGNYEEDEASLSLR